MSRWPWEIHYVDPRTLPDRASRVSQAAFAVASSVAVGRASRATVRPEVERLRAEIATIGPEVARPDSAARRAVGFALSEARLDLDYAEESTSVTSLRLSKLLRGQKPS